MAMGNVTARFRRRSAAEGGEEEDGVDDAMLRSSNRWVHSSEDINMEPWVEGLGPKSGDGGGRAQHGGSGLGENGGDSGSCIGTASARDGGG